MNKTSRVRAHSRSLKQSKENVCEPAMVLERTIPSAAVTHDHTPSFVDSRNGLSDIAPICFYTLDRQARICELNEMGASLLSSPPSWLIGKSFLIFIARQDMKRFLRFLSRVTGPIPKSIELDIHSADRTVPVRIAVATSAHEEKVLHRLTVLDLSGFRNTQRLLQESLSNWYSLVQNAPDTIMTVEFSGRICFVNRPAWGYSVNALIGTNLLDLVPEGSRAKLLRCLSQSFKLNKKSAREFTGLCGDLDNWYSFSFGSPHPFVPVGRQGTTTTTVIIREISEQKRMETTLRTSSEQLRDFAARLEAVREEERTRVSREIHDELGQALTALKLDLSWMHKKCTNNIRKELKSTITRVDDTIEKVRRIASQLRPPVLDDLGLIPAIDWQLRDFRRRTGIYTEVVCNVDELNISAEASAAVFRVLQEALTNIIRHAKAARVCVTIDFANRSLRMVIEDNGQGMKYNRDADLRSLGIIGMKERISRLGGLFQVFSEPGKGTRLDILIPTP